MVGIDFICRLACVHAVHMYLCAYAWSLCGDQPAVSRYIVPVW